MYDNSPIICNIYSLFIYLNPISFPCLLTLQKSRNSRPIHVSKDRAFFPKKNILMLIMLKNSYLNKITSLFMFNIQWSGAIFTVGCCTSLGISLRHFKLEMLKMHIDLFKNILLLMHIYINVLLTY